MKAKFYEPKFTDGNILAIADVDIASGIIVRGFRVVRGKNGVFAAVPSRAFTSEGQTRYWNQVVFTSPAIRDRFLAELLNAYELWERERSTRGPEATGVDEGAAESRSRSSATGA